MYEQFILIFIILTNNQNFYSKSQGWMRSCSMNNLLLINLHVNALFNILKIIMILIYENFYAVERYGLSPMFIQSLLIGKQIVTDVN